MKYTKWEQKQLAQQGDLKYSKKMKAEVKRKGCKNKIILQQFAFQD